MLSRENGKLRLKNYTLEVILDDLFEQCKNEDEVKWLFNNLKYNADKSATEKINQLDNEIGEDITTDAVENETLSAKGYCKDCKRLGFSNEEQYYCNGEPKGYHGPVNNIRHNFCGMFEPKI